MMRDLSAVPPAPLFALVLMVLLSLCMIVYGRDMSHALITASAIVSGCVVTLAQHSGAKDEHPLGVFFQWP